MREPSAEEARCITVRCSRPFAGAGAIPKRRPPVLSRQELVNQVPEKVMQRLSGCRRLDPEQYGDVELCTWIQYIAYDARQKPHYRQGGLLIQNGAPAFYRLRARGDKRLVWTLRLRSDVPGKRDPVLFVRDPEKTPSRRTRFVPVKEEEEEERTGPRYRARLCGADDWSE